MRLAAGHVLPIAALSLAAASPAVGGAWTEVADFGDNPGNLAMHAFAPDGLQPVAPLAVVLHGCFQTARDFAEEAGWTWLAERARLLLVAPEQRLANNGFRCFRWFLPEQSSRGLGEARSIRAMVDKALAEHRVDPTRVFVAGLSAGGAMAAALLAAYPNVFRAGAVVAGLPYGCADTSARATACLAGGRDLSAPAWGRLVLKASDHRGPWPAVSIWHGSGDRTVHPKNARELLEQWTNVHGIDQFADAEEKGEGYHRAEHRDAGGRAVVESFLLAGAGHGMPVASAEGCGRRGVYALDLGLCAVARIARFWGLETR
jgi:poly(hydroxyalkanoate) depolymerase family esterase